MLTTISPHPVVQSASIITAGSESQRAESGTYFVLEHHVQLIHFENPDAHHAACRTGNDPAGVLVPSTAPTMLTKTTASTLLARSTFAGETARMTLMCMCVYACVHARVWGEAFRACES